MLYLEAELLCFGFFGFSSKNLDTCVNYLKTISVCCPSLLPTAPPHSLKVAIRFAPAFALIFSKWRPLGFDQLQNFNFLVLCWQSLRHLSNWVIWPSCTIFSSNLGWILHYYWLLRLYKITPMRLAAYLRRSQNRIAILLLLMLYPLNGK